MRVGREELDDRCEVDVGLFAVHADDLRLAVGDELFGLCLGEDCHMRFLGLCGPEWPGHTAPPGHEGSAQGIDHSHHHSNATVVQ